MSTSCTSYVDGTFTVWVGVGWGGACQRHVHLTLMLRSWGGLGWGGVGLGGNGANAWKTESRRLQLTFLNVVHYKIKFCRKTKVKKK